MLNNSSEPTTTNFLASAGENQINLIRNQDSNKDAKTNWATWMVHDDVINKSRILVIDDEPVILHVVRRYLQDIGYQSVLTTSDSSNAVSLISDVKPDIVLLDIVMPQVNGLEILSAMRADPAMQMIPVIIMTASTEPETKVLSLQGGATDFLRKPMELTELFARVRNALTSKNYHDQLRDHAVTLERQAAKLECEVNERTAELLKSRTETIECLARAAEYRDDDTGQHIIRVGRYAAIIAQEVGFEKPRIEILEQAAQLHDVGKIGISDLILLKPGKLDADEFDIIKKHCEYGKKILCPPQQDEMGERDEQSSDEFENNPIMALASTIAVTHHERWDGTGYPNGLEGEEIPIEGRITAIADVYDALSSKRPYKDAFPHDKCMAILEEGRGAHFDPTLLDAFQRCEKQVLKVRCAFTDNV